MSNRISNIDVASAARPPQGQTIISHNMFQVINMALTAALNPGAVNSDFLPEASIIMPHPGSVAAISFKIYNVPISVGSVTVQPANATGAGVYPLGLTLNTSVGALVQRYPKGAIPFLTNDSLHVVYSTSATFTGPSGATAGYRLGLWVWQ